MARISGVVVPDNRQAAIALTYIYGIGPKTSRDILSEAAIDPTTRVKDLNEGQISRLQELITNKYTVEGELHRIVTGNIKRLKDIGTYRGARHSANLPVRGQRTRTNARTRRGKRVTVAGTAKKAPEKT